MRIRPFDFKVATNLADALNQLDQAGPDARLLAGGTDLVLSMKKKKILPSTLISLQSVANLEYIKEDNGVIHIGAMAKHADLAVHPLLMEQIPVLCEAVGLIGSWQVRNIGTIGGNLCNASPAADSAPPLLVLDAEIVLVGQQGERIVPITSFFRGPAQTVMQSNEILKEIRVKKPNNHSSGCYLKLRRRKAVDVSIAGVAVQVESDSSGQVTEQVKVALGGVAPMPIRVPEAEKCLEGLSIEEALEKIHISAEIAASAAEPIDDVRASADYKRTVVNVFVQRSARQVLTTIKNNRGRS